MSHHRATIKWSHGSGDFLRGTYSREHRWSFDGGVSIAASASTAVVPVPYANPAGVDPEQAFVAAIASCHMLTFLHVARQAGIKVVAYQDTAVGVLTKNERGVPWVSSVVLYPRITYTGSAAPTEHEERQLHEAAHEECFIANSVRTSITVSLPPTSNGG